MSDESKESRVQLSRRTFLKLSALTAAAGLVSGCSPRLETIADSGQVTVYGKDSPISQEGLGELMGTFKDQAKNGERVQEPDKVYLTTFIDQNLYGKYQQLYGETYENFLTRQMREYNQMLRNARPVGVKQVVLRESIVVQPGVATPMSYLPGYLENSVSGSDGTWGEMETMAAWGRPGEAFDRVHWKHEVWHWLFRGPDGYALTYNPVYESELPLPLTDLSPAWRNYGSYDRTDIAGSGDITQSARTSEIWRGPIDRQAGVNSKIGTWAALMLDRRIKLGTVHDWKDSYEDYGGWWRSDLPQQVSLSFVGLDGRPIQVSGLEFYPTMVAPEQSVLDRTLASKDYPKILSPEVILRTDSTNVNMADMLKPGSDGLISINGATLLVRITDENKDRYFRWLDVRDFQIAYWLGYEEHATLELKAGRVKDTISPADFPWKIKYGK